MSFIHFITVANAFLMALNLVVMLYCTIFSFSVAAIVWSSIGLISSSIGVFVGMSCLRMRK